MARLGRGKIRDVTGQKFNYLVAVSYNVQRSREAGDAYWDCKCLACDSAKLKTIRLSHLISGSIKSCGCRTRERTHGQTKGGKVSPEYSVWAGMMRRCFNPREKAYVNYGEHGITVCKAWRRFENFFADMGKRPTVQHSIDREDNDGGYWCGHCDECVSQHRPANCRWATVVEQNRNKRRHIFIEFQGEKLMLIDWAKRYNLPPYLLRQRLIRNGWTIEKALTTPR
jgi:hypothetical protein